MMSKQRTGGFKTMVNYKEKAKGSNQSSVLFSPKWKHITTKATVTILVLKLVKFINVTHHLDDCQETMISYEPTLISSMGLPLP